MIIGCLFGCVLIALSLHFRPRAEQSADRSADMHPAGLELANAPEPKPTRGRMLFQSVKRDPALETPSFEQQPPEDPDECRQWARENPELALGWMTSASASPQRDAVVELVCAQIAERDPAQAVALAERYTGGCSNLIENLVHQWAERDDQAAYAYAVRLAPEEERDRLLSRVAFIRSKANPAEAADLVVREIAAGEIQDEAVISVLHQWALREPNHALAWAQLFPEGALRERALKEIENLVSPITNQ